MFDALNKLDESQVMNIAYYARLAIDRRMGSEDLRRFRFLRGTEIEPTARERQLAIDMLAELEQHLGHPIPEASAAEINQCYHLIYRKQDELRKETPSLPPEELKKLFDRLYRVPMQLTYDPILPLPKKKKSTRTKAKALKRASSNGHAKKRTVKS
jgi:hypothetical protein